MPRTELAAITFDILGGYNVPGLITVILSGLVSLEAVDQAATVYLKIDNPEAEMKATILETIWLVVTCFKQDKVDTHSSLWNTLFHEVATTLHQS